MKNSRFFANSRTPCPKNRPKKKSHSRGGGQTMGQVLVLSENKGHKKNKHTKHTNTKKGVLFWKRTTFQ